MKRHTGNTANTVHKRCARSVVIQITTTQPLIEMVDKIVETGFFGTSRAAAAERLLGEALRQQLKEGTIQKQKKAFE